MRRLGYAFVLMMSLTAGCGGGGGSLTLQEFGNEVAAVYCAKSFACCTAAERMAEGFTFTDEASCRTTLAGFYTVLIGQYQASIDSGRLEYNGENAADCVATGKDMSCTEFFGSDLVDACADPFVGKQSDGMPCADDEECVSNYCEGDADQPPMEGTCKAIPGMGAACPDFECADGLTCDIEPTTGDRICQPLRADGAECFSRTECMSGGCNGGDPAMGMPGTCGAPMTCDGI